MPCLLFASAALICKSHICWPHDTCVTHVNFSRGHVPFEKKMAKSTVINCATRREMEKLVGSREIFLRASMRLRSSLPTVISNADVPKTAEVAYDLRIFICIFHRPFYFMALSLHLLNIRAFSFTIIFSFYIT